MLTFLTVFGHITTINKCIFIYNLEYNTISLCKLNKIFKIFKRRMNTSLRKHYFLQRVLSVELQLRRFIFPYLYVIYILLIFRAAVVLKFY
jgi:hypothetical protein